MIEVNGAVNEQDLSDLARDVTHRASRRWGAEKPTVIVGRDPSIATALEKTVRFAVSDEPVLLTGETGTGKELFARATYLYSRRAARPFLAVNCAQYHDGQLMASELFGHKRGSFTGAVADHRGVFEEANGGVVFLDEVGELSPNAQAMLLRVLGEGEIVPVGETRARRVDVQVVAATSRDLFAMIESGRFRSDLYYRLRYFHVHVPAVRERGDDWELVARYFLGVRARHGGTTKRLSADSMRVMGAYHWPGNVRELRSVVDMAFHLSSGQLIESDSFSSQLESRARRDQMQRVSLVPGPHEDLIERMRGGESFWTVVHRPYLNREISRLHAKELIERGLHLSRGSYKRLLLLFNIEASDYLKFMDFLRHQKLKPDF